MISKKLKERTFLIKGTPLQDRAKDAYSHRRGKTAVVMEMDDVSEKYDTFFEYEEDLANLKPSGEQYAEMVSKDPYIILEDRDDLSDEDIGGNKDKGITMSLKEDVINKPDENNDLNRGYKDVVGFDFVQCSFVKSDNERCKRQAPKGHVICSVHKKYKEKHGH
tara:strand:- start:312 stop:803 length:492 start_codon:yes stop_codon:yes gene_type:complete